MPWWSWLIIVCIIILPLKMKVWRKMFTQKNKNRDED